MSLSFTQVNSKTGDSTIYLDRMTSLDLSLINDGDTIEVVSGTNAAILTIFLPDFFSPSDINIMTIDQPDWTFARFVGNNINNCYLSLTYTGSDFSWNNGDQLTFTIERVDVLSTIKTLPYSSRTTINFENLSPLTTSNADLTLDNPPPLQGSADLKEVLQVFLSDQGRVYMSYENDELENTLYLNFKNTGSDPLSNIGGGQVTVEFVYGSTAGDLTTDDKGGGDESAWNILGAPNGEQGSGWTVDNPDTSDSATSPSWTLNPTNTNTNVIGTGADANVSFSFSKIISFLDPGNTQMIVSFKNFKKDANTDYNDATYVLNIVKLETPPLRGLTNFYCDTLIYEISSPQDVISLDLVWSMYYVDQVVIMTDRSDYRPETFPSSSSSYSDTLYTDHQTIKLSGIYTTGPITISAQAFDGNGNYLNRIEFTVYVESSYIQTQAAQELAIIRQKISQLSQDMSGLLRFYCKSEKITYDINNVKSSDSNQVELVLWTHGVSYVELFTNYLSPTIDSTSTDKFINASTDKFINAPIDTPPTITHCVDTTLEQSANTATVTLPILNTDPITIIAKAYDSGHNLLNTMECTVFVEIPYIADKDTDPYPTVRIGNLLWMTKNLDWDSGDSNHCMSYPANDTYADDQNLGKLYNPYYAVNYAQPGWRLPAPSNWQDLFDLYGSQSNGSCIQPDTYNAFLGKDGGASGLNIQLGGYYSYSNSKINDEASVGCYASSYLPGSGLNSTAVFDGNLRNTSIPTTSGYSLVSVRFVTEIPFVQIQEDDQDDNQ